VDATSSDQPRGPSTDETVGPEPGVKLTTRIKRLPFEIGLLLFAAGLTAGMLPPPPGPFDLSVMLSGCLVLWPRGFRAMEGWAHHRFPKAYAASSTFLRRYLDDLERRYPGSAH
jgi:hypothetical protein